ncbi:MAG: heavy-metal-associated domain-containing protein [Thiotrichales bacterium]|jgi:copper chaperone|nr:heavy-metal-associated domain-containing protein [Thiotrichales bacterium]MBT3613093.1 heavy-metal-associated domain-containing protein [Thiotrichales bacterium]MBT3752136.1 heavy-metal-associated domain-containing protein [Thiotrichales bacterium]MBT3837808.1 heavy-metal-associated domain-containing protein [Thiotrichales bacterium]MBT4152777.1 heavy-metal-associated domain-containing protein [Thiotrichales bacterium]
MQKTVNVANVMCGGCSSTIESNLTEMDGVNKVEVNVEKKSVTLEFEDSRVDEVMAKVTEKLTELGYPVQ